MIAAALVLVETTRGITDASMTRSRSTPRTRSRASTTERASPPMRQVPAGWNTVPPLARANASSAAGVVDAVARQVLLAGDQVAKRRLRVDLAQDAQAGDEDLRVARIGEVAGADARRRERIGARDLDRCRVDSGRHCAADAEKPEKRCSGSPGLSTESGMTLKSTSARPPLRVLGRDQAADLAGADRQRPALAEQPLRAHLREARADCGRRR